jgi:hypothetical protein
MLSGGLIDMGRLDHRLRTSLGAGRSCDADREDQRGAKKK